MGADAASKSLRVSALSVIGLLVLPHALGSDLDKRAQKIFSHVDSSRPTPAYLKAIRPITDYERERISRVFGNVQERVTSEYRQNDCFYSISTPPTPLASWNSLGSSDTGFIASEVWIYPTCEVRYGDSAYLIQWPRRVKHGANVFISEDGSGLNALHDIHVQPAGSLWNVTAKMDRGGLVAATVDPTHGYLATRISAPIGTGGEVIHFAYGSFKQVYGGAWEPMVRSSYVTYQGTTSRKTYEKILAFQKEPPAGDQHLLNLFQKGRVVIDNRTDRKVEWTYADLLPISKTMPITPDTLLALSQDRSKAELSGRRWQFQGDHEKSRLLIYLASAICLVLLSAVFLLLRRKAPQEPDFSFRP